jgi:hypothetical protein
MRRFTREEIHAYLKALDSRVRAGCSLIVIGGAAASLSFGAPGGTVDIDTANPVGDLSAACESAAEECGLSIPLARASVYDGPRHFKSRLQRFAGFNLSKLTVLVPEKHDWALMKVVRYEDKDAEHIKAAAAAVGFDLETFKERFLSEMVDVEPRDRVIIRFLAMIEDLFGAAAADRLQTSIKAHKDWQ